MGEGIAPGTPAYDELLGLQAQLENAAAGIAQFPPPPENLALMAALAAPEPELAERQLAFGFNGPAEAGALLLRSEDEVQQSWLAAALPPEELASVLSRTDFSRQVLVVYALGLHQNASGTIFLSELSYREDIPGAEGRTAGR